MVVSTAEFKKGLKIQFDGQPYSIVDFQHVKPGQGGAFVRTKPGLGVLVLALVGNIAGDCLRNLMKVGGGR